MNLRASNLHHSHHLCITLDESHSLATQHIWSAKCFSPFICSLLFRRQSRYSGCLRRLRLFLLSLQHTILNRRAKKKGKIELLNAGMFSLLISHQSLCKVQKDIRGHSKRKFIQTKIQATPSHTPLHTHPLSIVATVSSCK